MTVDHAIFARWPAQYPDRLQLFSTSTPNGVKVGIMLEETSLPYEPHRIDIMANETHDPAFLALNPNGKIPAIYDPDGPSGTPLALFESGAILLYLAGKTGKFIPRSLRGQVTALEWLMWQMAGLGPMAGQNHHFASYAPEKIPYAIERYVKETSRLYAVLDKRLAGRDFIVGREYTIADMACYPWIIAQRQGQDIEDFPNVKRWHASIKARPATARAYALVKQVNPNAGGIRTEEERKVLFGQDRSVVK